MGQHGMVWGIDARSQYPKGKTMPKTPKPEMQRGLSKSERVEYLRWKKVLRSQGYSAEHSARMAMKWTLDK
jgi:hypothetical protein